MSAFPRSPGRAGQERAISSSSTVACLIPASTSSVSASWSTVLLPTPTGPVTTATGIMAPDHGIVGKLPPEGPSRFAFIWMRRNDRDTEPPVRYTSRSPSTSRPCRMGYNSFGDEAVNRVSEFLGFLDHGKVSAVLEDDQLGVRDP